MNVVRISDGLGNQMFQYAFARKISILTGKKVYLDTRFVNNEDFIKSGNNIFHRNKLGYREYGLSHFKIVLPLADEKIVSHWKYLKQDNCVDKAFYGLSLMNKWIWKYKKEDLNFDGALPKFKWDFPAYYQGYFFDLNYYDDIWPLLKREFSLKQKIKLSSDLHAVLNDENTVSLHVRRGDFLRLNRDISSSGYYDKAIKYVESQIDRPVYFIFSDDINWVNKNMDIPRKKIFVSSMGFQDYEELIIMKHCKHNIIANSTFSYWGAYLNDNEDKIVVCPRNWRSRIIPKSWRKC